MSQRLKGVAILIPVLMGFFLGDYICSLTSMIVGMFIYHELHEALIKKDIEISYSFGIIMALALHTFLLFSRTYDIKNILILVSMASIFSLFVQDEVRIKNIIASISCTIYAFIPFWLISILNLSWANTYLKLLIFAIAFSTDTFAFLIGKHFGKHPLSKISPKKTIEGSIGGIVCTCIFCGVGGGLVFDAPVLTMILTAIIGSILAQLGDLFASSVKRYCGIKDFSDTIPGHGGFLDRFDSVIFVIPLIFSLAIVFL